MNELRFAFYVALFVTAVFVILPIEIIDATTHQIWGQRDDKYGRGSWCEKAFHNEIDKFMREQMNARSDYCYVLVGIWMVIVSLFDLRRKYCMTNIQGLDQNTNHDGTEVPRIIPRRTEDDLKISSGDTSTQHEGLRGEGKEEIDDDPFPKLLDDDSNNAPEYDEEGVDIKDDDYIEEEIPNAILNFPQIGLVNGLVNICHGFGSFFNHACQCPAGSAADVAGMLAVMIFPTLYMPVLLVMGRLTTTTRTRSNNVLIQSIVLIPTIGQPALMILFWTVSATRFYGSSFTLVATAFGSHVLFLTYIIFGKTNAPTVGVRS